MIDYYSVVPLFIELILEEDTASIATGTAFAVTHNGSNYLITNWHCVTGRDPNTNAILPNNSYVDPNFVKVWFCSQYVGNWIPITLRIRNENGDKLWIEHPLGSVIDVVAIPFSTLDNCVVKFLDLANADIPLKIYPSKAVSILGFPLGLTAGGKFPIWVTGHIASEFSYDFDGKPLFYIDAATITGMSGSPVILRESGICEFENNPGEPAKMKGGTYTRFLGVYSGRVDNRTQIGRVWKPSVIQDILTSLR